MRRTMRNARMPNACDNKTARRKKNDLDKMSASMGIFTLFCLHTKNKHDNDDDGDEAPRKQGKLLTRTQSLRKKNVYDHAECVTVRFAYVIINL